MELGRIVNRHGIRGEVRVRPHNPDTTAFDRLDEVDLCWPDGRMQTRVIRAARPHKNCILMQLEGVASANDAEALIGCTVHIPLEKLPELESGQFYVGDLIGCAVRTESGEALGTVAEVMNTGSSDILVVRDGKREVLIPLIDDVAPRIDLPGRHIVITPMAGLLDPA